MAASNKFGWIVLTTGNKSEMATGYATLYGDMAGGFAVIKDVPKTLVQQLARHRNAMGGREVVPESIIVRPPTAELRPDQRDEDSLPPYDVLDPILEAYVEQDRSLDEMLAAGMPREAVELTVRLVDRSEYKRRQAPPRREDHAAELRPRPPTAHREPLPQLRGLLCHCAIGAFHSNTGTPQLLNNLLNTYA